MPLTCAQIVTLALQDSRKNAPFVVGGGFSLQAGQLLQMILDDLCYKFDLKVNLTPVAIALTGIPTPPQFIGETPGVGPYPLPSNYLRMAQDEIMYVTAGGAPHKMVNDDLSTIDLVGLLPLTSNYPERFATDFSTIPPSLYVWPPPISLINIDMRYFKLQPPISSPESSATVPWFVDGMYLRSRLTGELLKPGAAAVPFLEKEAPALLDQYLKMEDDSEGRAIVIKMDERRFGRGVSSLPRTKGFDF